MPRRKKDQSLTVKEKRFVNEYVKTGNGTQSALKAYNTKNPGTAQSIAVENLLKPVIAAAVQQEFKKEELTVEWVLKNMKELAEKSKEDGVKTRNLELIGKHLRMFIDIRENKDTSDDLPTDAAGRKQEVDRVLERLNALRETESGR